MQLQHCLHEGMLESAGSVLLLQLLTVGAPKMIHLPVCDVHVLSVVFLLLCELNKHTLLNTSQKDPRVGDFFSVH